MPARHLLAQSSRILPDVVEGGGFEPPKSTTSDLQSGPFGHSGTPPEELRRGVEHRSAIFSLFAVRLSIFCGASRDVQQQELHFTSGCVSTKRTCYTTDRTLSSSSHRSSGSSSPTASRKIPSPADSLYLAANRSSSRNAVESISSVGSQ